MQLSAKEHHIIRALIDKQNEAGVARISIDELNIYFREVWHLPMPKHWRRAMAVTLRDLSRKLKTQGCTIRRVSKLGRGYPGIYEARGNLKRLL